MIPGQVTITADQIYIERFTFDALMPTPEQQAIAWAMQRLTEHAVPQREPTSGATSSVSTS